jgi:nucleotide sugar dehydrogenase
MIRTASASAFDEPGRGSAPARECLHEPARFVQPWVGEAGSAGTVAVIGVGRTGLPLVAQFSAHGWRVIAADVRESLIASLSRDDGVVTNEPGVAQEIARARDEGRLSATIDAAEAAQQADVVVVTVPVLLNDEYQPDLHAMDAALDAVAAGLHAGSLLIVESTLPVSATRGHATRLETATNLRLDDDLFVAYGPQRITAGTILADLATYPKLVGGIGPASTARAASFYDSVLDGEIVTLASSESAELAKLAETTYRDLNIALANDLARYAERLGIDVGEVIAAANSSPFSNVHRPGIGVGGPSVPVHPRFLLAGAPELELVEHARRVNDGQVGAAIKAIQLALGALEGVEILVLGLTYRAGVKELAHSRALPLIERLGFHGAIVSAWDPLLDADEIAHAGGRAWAWGETAPFRVIVSQTDDPAFRRLDFAWFPELELVFDGRNSLRNMTLPVGVAYHGVGVPARPAQRPAVAGHRS